MSRDADSVEVLHEPGVDVSWAIHVNHFTGDEPTAETTRIHAPTTLAVEAEIAARTAEHGPAVARVAHSFGGRDIHLRDGSRIEFRWQLVVSDWRCLDCRIDTDAISEYYMLHIRIPRSIAALDCSIASAQAPTPGRNEGLLPLPVCSAP